MKENFPSLAKEIDFQEVQESQRVPKKLDPRRNTPRHIIVTFPKIKQKKRILEAARERENQDGGVGRHTAPSRTTRIDRESNSKGDQHQGNRK